ncbi:MAG: phosphate butyryltransferase [Elusimicrobia bacterium CG08_land_8_20_14_0_20_59_10]|nr:MAG: phosphate butyryltransferase [Elusimicrobia bacterium CG08_land_8_20_14_0_20_59_10]
MNFKNFDELLEKVRGKTNRIVVPGANNDEVLTACRLGVESKIISGGILIGPKAQVEAMAAKVGLGLGIFEIMDMSDIPEICNKAVDLVKEGKGDFLVKGLVDTKFYMKAILRKEVAAVPEGRLLSHFVLFELANYHKLFAVTDAAILINPTLEQKAGITQNAVEIMRALGVEKPKVAVVCPVEKVNPKIQSTLDAEALVKMNKEGTLKDCVVEGPYDVYISFSKELAAEKGIKDALVPGDTDIALFPSLDSANPVYKCLSFFGAGMRSATLLVGCNIPVILPSRTDSPVTKLHSIALACYLKDAAKVAAK